MFLFAVVAVFVVVVIAIVACISLRFQSIRTSVGAPMKSQSNQQDYMTITRTNPEKEWKKIEDGAHTVECKSTVEVDVNVDVEVEVNVEVERREVGLRWRWTHHRLEDTRTGDGL
ncbi:hypothetical protein BDN70DRAFT_886899 [Pholiota conissans]|uniref:Uncharacterized protein n=1 Tax=Pholiota conissans TaxID=109636 RepID=A0A9P5YPB0_9AGAR|nr:hypothetical protein BDN70DRAFT_886899 [Pholiota conissans]